MPDPILNPMQPFINLVQANMALLSNYAMSPEAMSAAMAQVQAALTQGQVPRNRRRSQPPPLPNWPKA